MINDNAPHGGFAQVRDRREGNCEGIPLSETLRASGLSSLWRTCGQHFHGSIANLEQRDIVGSSAQVKHQHLVGG